MQIETPVFVAACKEAMRVIARRNVIPVLGCIRVTAEGEDACSISATDLDRDVRVTVPAVVNGDASPTILTGTDPSFRVVLMPMRV